jgi:hypothetical protein
MNYSCQFIQSASDFTALIHHYLYDFQLQQIIDS